MVSHEVSHLITSSGLGKKLIPTGIKSLHQRRAEKPSDIIWFVYTVHRAPYRTCTQCVPVALLANSDRFIDRSDRASSSSLVCWQSIVRSCLCKKKFFLLLSQKPHPLFEYQKVVSIDSSPQAISKQLWFAVFKESAQSHYNAFSKNKSVISARGW